MRIVDASRRAFILLLAVGVTSAWAADFTRFQGGGRVANDCLLIEDVAGVSGGRAARCTDGDPACDVDGVANGTCAFRVRLCLNAAPGLQCKADVITAATIMPASEPVAALATALASLPMPVTMPDTCTELTTVAVPTRGRQRGRLVLRAAATVPSGPQDRDRLTFICSPARQQPGVTFGQIQGIFRVSCASASCHGDAAAGGLSLGASDGYQNLVGVPPVNPPARAAELLRVAPGDPERSFILSKLDGRLGAGEGQRMPWGAPPLRRADIALMRRWIKAGAPSAGPATATAPGTLAGE